MFKYNLGDNIFCIYKNKIQEGKIVARKNIENLNGYYRPFAFDDGGITYNILFGNNDTWRYKEEHIFDSAESCIEYVSQ